MAISFQIRSPVIAEKIRGYPQFSFWIQLITLAKICFFHEAINPAKILLYWGSKSRDAQNVCAVTKDQFGLVVCEFFELEHCMN